MLYRLLEPHRDRMVQVTQAANLGSTHRFLALLSAARRRPRAPPSSTSRPRWRSTGCGLRPVVALMRREYAEMLIARNRDGDRARAEALLRQTLREAEQGGMSQLISRVQLRLAELQA